MRTSVHWWSCWWRSWPWGSSGNGRGTCWSLWRSICSANATTQILKLTLAHPRLQGALGVDYPIEIHYPSGHTTAAVSAGFALWLIAPPKWRGWAALFAAKIYGGAVGLGVIIDHWRLGRDVIGAVLVVGFWASLALAAMVTAKMEEPADWLPREGQTTNPAK